MAEAYQAYRQNYPDNPNINGQVFEYLVCEVLAREGITPFYRQAKFERVPNAIYDVVCYDPARPVVLTMKASLRERYKQADLEGLALRQVYWGAENHLITLPVDEARRVQTKIEGGEVAGLDSCRVASAAEFTDLIGDLKHRKFHTAEAVMPLTGQRFPTK